MQEDEPALLQATPHPIPVHTSNEEGPPKTKKSTEKADSEIHGADDGVRTRDPNLGKVVLYQLSHVRNARRYDNKYYR